MDLDIASKLYDEVFGRLQAKVPMVLRWTVGMVQGWYSFWVVDGQQYEIEGEEVKCMRQGQVLFCLEKAMVDFFVMMYYENGAVQAVRTCLDPFYVFPNVISPFTHYIIPKALEEESCGQLKLLCNALEVFETNKVNAVIIGSGGPEYTRSGATYLHLAPLLEGKMTLYDPFEKNQEVKTDGAHLSYKGRMFEYRGLPDPSVTHVIDDSFDVVTAVIQEDDEKVRRIETDIVIPYNGPFVTIAAYDILHVLRCKNHSDMKYMKPNGGGRVYTIKGQLTFYGSSNTYGPFNAKIMRRLMPLCIIKDPCTFSVAGKMNELKRLFPKARISTKYLQNQPQSPFTNILEQRFYYGTELREYYRVQVPNLDRPDLTGNVHCKICALMESSAVRLKASLSSVQQVFALVGGFSCFSRPGITKTNLRGEILVMAKTWSLRKTVCSVLHSKYHIAEHVVDEMIKAMISWGKIMPVRSNIEERICLVSSTMDEQLSTNSKMDQISIWYEIAKKENIGYLMGLEHRKISDSPKHMYIGDEYKYDADIAIVQKQTVQMCATYEQTHDVKTYKTEVYFVHKKYNTTPL